MAGCGVAGGPVGAVVSGGTPAGVLLSAVLLLTLLGGLGRGVVVVLVVWLGVAALLWCPPVERRSR